MTLNNSEFTRIFPSLLIGSLANAFISITDINRARLAGFVLSVLVNGTLLPMHALAKISLERELIVK